MIAVLAFLMPAESLLALTLVFGAFAFADGVFGLVAAVRNIRGGDRWGWLMFSGILGIATGSSWSSRRSWRRLCLRHSSGPASHSGPCSRGALEIARHPPAKGNQRRNLADPERPSLSRSRCRRDLDAADAPGRKLPRARLADRLLRRGLRGDDDHSSGYGFARRIVRTVRPSMTLPIGKGVRCPVVDDERLAGEEHDFTRWDETIFDRCRAPASIRSAAVRRQSSCAPGRRGAGRRCKSRACHLTPKMRGADVEPPA